MPRKKEDKKEPEKAEKETEEEPKEEKPVDIVQAVKDDAQMMKENLARQPKMNFLIPLSSGEKEGAYDTVCLNGYRLVIKKGVMVQLPEQVADVLAEKYRINMTAGRKFNTERTKEVKEALE